MKYLILWHDTPFSEPQLPGRPWEKQTQSEHSLASFLRHLEELLILWKYFPYCNNAVP